MKDLFQKYHRQKILTRIGLLSLSVVLAISINTFMFTGESANMLKASILEATQKTSPTVDFEGNFSGEMIDFSANMPMETIQEFSYSLAYNADELTLSSPTSNYAGEITEFGASPGFTTILFTPDSPITIPAGSTIISQGVEKIKDDTTGIINIVNVNFTDTTENTYQLTTQGIIF